MTRYITYALFITLAIIAACNEQTKPDDGSKFATGQVWKYKNRPGEDSSTLTILRIEYYATDTIVHIRVDGVNVYSPKAAGGYTHSILHLPYSPEALRNSVTVLKGKNEHIPDFSEGYKEWRKSWDRGSAGYFTKDVKDIVENADNAQRTPAGSQ
jgi:hypothetical protein